MYTLYILYRLYILCSTYSTIQTVHTVHTGHTVHTQDTVLGVCDSTVHFVHIFIATHPPRPRPRNGESFKAPQQHCENPINQS